MAFSLKYGYIKIISQLFIELEIDLFFKLNHFSVLL